MPGLHVTYARVTITRGAHAALLGHVRAEPHNETGGILVGTANEDGLHITGVSPPGPNAVRKPRFFKRDVAFVQKWLERRCADAVDGSDYIGEWHVHPALDAPPSCVDRRSLRRIARAENYSTSEPLLLIVESVGQTRRLCGYRFGPRRRDQRRVPVEVG